MTELLKLMEDGTSWSLDALAVRLGTTVDDVKRQMEYLEQLGYLRRIGSCGHNCKGCSAHCGAGGNLSGFPVFWELTGR